MSWPEWYEPIAQEWNLESGIVVPNVFVPLGSGAYTCFDAIPDEQDAWLIDWLQLPGPVNTQAGYDDPAGGVHYIAVYATTIGPGGFGNTIGTTLETIAEISSGSSQVVLDWPLRLNYGQPRLIVAPRIVIYSHAIDSPAPPPAANIRVSATMQAWRLRFKGKRGPTSSGVQAEQPFDGGKWWEAAPVNDPPRRVAGPSWP